MNLGLLLGFIGVSIFSFTMPMTKLGLAAGLSAPFISFGRAVLAGAIAALVLLITRARVPTAQERKYIALATLGIVFGWPLFSTLGLLTATPSHAAVVNGLLPFSTAFIGAMLTKKWPRQAFWICAAAGAVVVCGYAWLRSGGGWVWADALFLVGVVLGGLGYSAGARATETMPGWHVISWALVLGLPVTIPVSLAFAPQWGNVSAQGWWCFLYLAVMSQYIGFFFWYRGLQMGGIAKVSQVQLLQIFMTIGVSSVLVGESIGALTWGAAALTVIIIAISKRL
jgi:drug/metabolite transporter (DMT)-like permease